MKFAKVMAAALFLRFRTGTQAQSRLTRRRLRRRAGIKYPRLHAIPLSAAPKGLLYPRRILRRRERG